MKSLLPTSVLSALLLLASTGAGAAADPCKKSSAQIAAEVRALSAALRTATSEVRVPARALQQAFDHLAAHPTDPKALAAYTAYKDQPQILAFGVSANKAMDAAPNRDFPAFAKWTSLNAKRAECFYKKSSAPPGH